METCRTVTAQILVQIQGGPLRDSSIGGARGSEPRGSRFESWPRSLTEAWPSLDYGTGLENRRAWAPEVQILSLPPRGGRSSMAERAVVARVVVGSIPTVHPRWACDLIGKGARLRPASWGFESSQAHWSHVTQLAEVSGSRPESCGFDSRRGYGHVGQSAESSASRAERW